MRKPETQDFLKRIIVHERLERIDEAIRAAHSTTGFRPQSVIITGQSGAGKTTLIERYAANVAIQSTETCAHVPVLVVEVPPQPDLRSLMTEMLRKLGHPRPDRKATLGQMRYQIIRQLTALRTELLIIDEFQDLLPRKTKASPAIMKLIKNLMNQLNLPLVLVGMPESTDILETGDGQLRRRFSASRTLAPFDIDTPEALAEFEGYLAALQSVLPIKCTHLAERNTALRMYCASQGLPGLMSKILASLINAHTGDRQATLGDLGRAYATALVDDTPVQDGRCGFNPFLVQISRVKQEVGAA